MVLVPLISYPKSGNTWLRFMLAHIFRSDRSIAVDYGNISKLTPTTPYFCHDEVLENLIPNSPVFIKEHDRFENMRTYNWERAICVYRNGFDVLLSYWNFVQAQSPGLYKDFDDFVEGYWKRWGHWGDHIFSWRKASESKNILFIRYEDLLQFPFQTLKECIYFLGLDVDDEIIEQSVVANTSEKMKKISGSASFMNAQQEGFNFVRSARTGCGSTLPKNVKDSFMKYQCNYDAMLFEGYLLKKDNVWEGLKKEKNITVRKRVNLKLKFALYSARRKYGIFLDQ